MLKLIALLLSLLLGLFSFSAEEPSISEDEQQLLIDYYDATVATVGGDHYTELVLCSNPDGSYEVDLFTKYEDEPETCTVYPADASLYEACVDVIREYSVDKWNDAEYLSAMDGRVCVCCFLLDGKTYRVSSDNMPDNGFEALNKIKNILNRALTE